MKEMIKDPSPCLTCHRVAVPANCENKRCNYWRRWFLRRWSLIHDYPRKNGACQNLCPSCGQCGQKAGKGMAQ